MNPECIPGPVAYLLIRHMVFVEDIQKLLTVSHLKTLDFSFKFF